MLKIKSIVTDSGTLNVARKAALSDGLGFRVVDVLGNASDIVMIDITQVKELLNVLQCVVDTAEIELSKSKGE